MHKEVKIKIKKNLKRKKKKERKEKEKEKKQFCKFSANNILHCMCFADKWGKTGKVLLWPYAFIIVSLYLKHNAFI